MVVVVAMLASSKRRARTAIQCCSVLGLVLLTCCSKKTSPPGATGGPDAGTTAERSKGKPGAAGGLSACRAPAKGATFTLGTPTPNTDAPDGEAESDDELPFATSLGNAVLVAGGFWVTAIDYRQKESHAVVAQIEPTVDRGIVVDLGRVYGDAEPPRIVAQGDQAIVVVPDSDAGGRTLKVGRLSSKVNRGRVEWFDAVTQGVDDSPVFSVATEQNSVVLAWDELDKPTHRGVVRFRAIRTTTDGSSSKPNVEVFRTPAEVDAEAPQLVKRTTGFWLAYLATEVAVESKRKNARPPSEGTGADDNAEERPVVELGKRGIQLLPLDVRGAVSGRPIVVTAPGAHVVAFEVEAMLDGGALVAYRDDARAPGVEGDFIELAEVHPDGSVLRLRLEDERVGVGAPLLMASSNATASEGVWVMVPGKSAEMQVTNYLWGSSRLSLLVGDPLLVGAEPLLRDGAALLVGRTRGRSVEFERIDCRFDGQKSDAGVK